MTRNVRLLIYAATAVFLTACNGDPPATDLKPEAQPAISVAVAKVTRADVQTWIFGEGTARALKREFLSFESPGRIVYVDPNLKEGDSVVQGQLIAYQEKNLPAAGNRNGDGPLSHTAVREAAANLDLAQKTFNRFALLLEQRSASQQEYDEAKAKLGQAQIAHQNSLIVADESRIISPINGVIARLNIEQGYYFSPQQIQSNSESGALNTIPVVIIDASAFEVTVSLASSAHGQIKVGARVLFRQRIGGTTTGMVSAEENADGVIRGTVYAISPSVDPNTRTFSVKLRTTASAERLQDGEYVYAWIAGPAADNTLTIPIDAMRFENNAPFVFRLDPEANVVAKVPITTGLYGSANRQVLAGLAEGDLVVTDGRSRLADGDLVRVIGHQPSASTGQPQ